MPEKEEDEGEPEEPTNQPSKQATVAIQQSGKNWDNTRRPLCVLTCMVLEDSGVISIVCLAVLRLGVKSVFGYGQLFPTYGASYGRRGAVYCQGKSHTTPASAQKGHFSDQTPLTTPPLATRPIPTPGYRALPLCFDVHSISGNGMLDTGFPPPTVDSFRRTELSDIGFGQVQTSVFGCGHSLFQTAGHRSVHKARLSNRAVSSLKMKS